MDNVVDANTWKNLNKGQQIAAGGGLAALIASFLPWYSVQADFFGGVSLKGIEFTFGWMGLLLFLAATALTLAPAFGKKVGTDQIGGEQIALIAAGLGGLLWLIRLLSVPGFGGINRGFGLFIAVAAGAAVIAGVVMNMKEQGIAMPTMANFQSTTTDTPAAAPQQYAAPQAAPAPQQYAAPQAAPAPQQYAAPQAAPAPAPQAAPANPSGHIEF